MKKWEALVLAVGLCMAVARFAVADDLFRAQVGGMQALAPAAMTGGVLSWRAAEVGGIDVWADLGLLYDQHAGSRGLLLGASTAKLASVLRQTPAFKWLPEAARVGAGWSRNSTDMVLYTIAPLCSW